MLISGNRLCKVGETTKRVISNDSTELGIQLFIGGMRNLMQISKMFAIQIIEPKINIIPKLDQPGSFFLENLQLEFKLDHKEEETWCLMWPSYLCILALKTRTQGS